MTWAKWIIQDQLKMLNGSLNNMENKTFCYMHSI